LGNVLYDHNNRKNTANKEYYFAYPHFLNPVEQRIRIEIRNGYVAQTQMKAK
jgi:hypothetical protein